jgi:cytochrome c7-like protein
MIAKFALAGLLTVAPLFLSMPALGQYEGVAFSHKKHTGMSLECVDCHAAAKTSEQAADVLLPRDEVCAKCHAPAPIKEPRKLTVSSFNHRLHAAIPKMNLVILAAIRSGSYLAVPHEQLEEQLESAGSCTTCHRGMAESEEVSMAAFPHMADCLVCHSDIEVPFSCEKCHDADPVALKPADIHTPDFLEAHSRPGALKDRTSCALCHGREFTCLGCH